VTVIPLGIGRCPRWSQPVSSCKAGSSRLNGL
jgi:hypothetical protein